MTLVADRITVYRGDRRVLDDFSLTAEPGSMTAIVGPNGAGKSTLLGVLSGDLAPKHGLITVGGHDVRDMSPRDAANVRSYLPQQHPSGLEYTVRTVVGFGRYAVGSPDDPVVDEAMERVGVDDLAERRFRDLSGGEQRRVSIARILAQTAPVVLMDEPTDSLDLGHADLVMNAASVDAATGSTVLVTSHDLNIASRHADRIILLADGRIAADGRPHEVFTEQALSSVYRTTVRVMEHPATGKPVIFL